MAKSKRQSELVYEAWNILVEAAGQGDVLTYGQLAARLSYLGYRLIAQYMPLLLTPIMHHCADHGLPLLNDLVVGQRSKRPNYAPPGCDHAASHRRIFAFDWQTVAVTEDDFAGR
jgi:hypothetical protein